jgi:hypothetical protein
MNKNGLLIVKPIFGRPAKIEVPTFVKTAFMLMPFSRDLTKVYNDIVRPAMEECGITINRADDFFSTGDVMEEIWLGIHAADLIIADVTGRNPNVFYELGIAHTLGKHVVILTQQIKDVPFDIRQKHVIEYGTRYDQVSDLTRQLTKAVNSVRGEIETERGFLRST